MRWFLNLLPVSIAAILFSAGLAFAINNPGTNGFSPYPPIASANTAGLVYADGSTITVAADGKLSAGFGTSIVIGTPSNPTGTASTSGVMSGVGSSCTITPTLSTRVRITVDAVGSNTVSGDGLTVTLRWGTGAAPANAAALTGTIIGSSRSMTVPGTGSGFAPFSVNYILTGLTLNTAIWFDLSEAAITGGTASIVNISCQMQEA